MAIVPEKCQIAPSSFYDFPLFALDHLDPPFEVCNNADGSKKKVLSVENSLANMFCLGLIEKPLCREKTAFVIQSLKYLLVQLVNKDQRSR